MHLYVITRGIKKDIDDFITQLQGAYLPYPVKDEKGNVQQTGSAQFSVRPVQLFEMVFPKESLDPVLMTMFDGKDGSSRWKYFNKFLTLLRKGMKLKPIPEDYNKTVRMATVKQNVEIIGVGIKEDDDLVRVSEGI